jgi:hypothetical protein
MNKLVRKWYNTIGVKLPIRRRNPLNDPEVIKLLKAAWYAGFCGEGFDTFLKSMR